MQRRTFQYIVLAIAAFTFTIALLRFDGPAKGYWDTYITAPAMFMNSQPVDFVLADGSPAFEPTLQGVLPDDLIDKDDFGIITKDQRLGSGVVASAFFAFFGLLGFRVLFAAAVALIIPLTVLLFGALQNRIGLSQALRGEVPPRREQGLAVASEWCALAGGVLLAWNPFVISVDRLNANLFALPMMLLVLWLLVAHRPRWLLVGLAFGVLATIRNEAVCFVPAICWWYLKPAKSISLPRRFGWLVGVGALTLVAMAPVLYFKGQAFGNPFLHPSQYPHFQGFRPEFAHSLLGWDFTFNGLFNWPLHDHLVRTPHFAFPTWLLFPLVTLRALGTLGIAVMLYGAWALHAHQRDVSILLLAWASPVYLLFGPQENWEEVKMTFMLLAWAPLAVWVPAGLLAAWGGDWAMVTGERSPKETSWWEAMRIPVTTLLLVAFLAHVGLYLASTVRAPADERWYVRFPNADKVKNPDAQAGLAERDRNEWRYFQSYETPEEIARERAKLTAGWPWPAVYLPLNWDFAREAGEMVDEAGERHLRVLEIWGYIYGTRRWPAGAGPGGGGSGGAGSGGDG